MRSAVYHVFRDNGVTLIDGQKFAAVKGLFGLAVVELAQPSEWLNE